MRLWAAEQFNKEHPDYSSTFAYKVLERMLDGTDKLAIKFIQDVKT